MNHDSIVCLVACRLEYMNPRRQVEYAPRVNERSVGVAKRIPYKMNEGRSVSIFFSYQIETFCFELQMLE